MPNEAPTLSAARHGGTGDGGSRIVSVLETRSPTAVPSCHKEAATTRLLSGTSGAHAIAAGAVGTFPRRPGAAKIGGGTIPQRRGAEDGSHVV